MPPYPLSRVASGDVEGRERGGVLLFAGIPYAEPPLATRRFRPPSPHPGWQGTRSARRFGPAAPQRPGVGLTAAPLAWDEDCLTLNVCTPAVDDGARPVLVWIHGGAFRTGKGGIPWYDGSSFARQGDIVTVTINYRLGALGYAHVGDAAGDDFASSGLTGLLDQIAALEWVRDNIAAFGGDPARVTIAGESAGAMSVGTLLGCPGARGLFRAAIAQSGAAHHTLCDAESREVGRDVAELLGADHAGALQAVEVDAILDAQEAAEKRFAQRQRGRGGPLSDMAYQPAVGHAALPEAPIEAIRRGASSDVALLCGTNFDETTLWGYGRVDEARLHRFAERLFGERAEDAVATYRGGRPQASPSALLIAMTTDHIFRIPAIRLCEAHAANAGASWS
jgi:para-nitrobenzyl esterase